MLTRFQNSVCCCVDWIEQHPLLASLRATAATAVIALILTTSLFDAVRIGMLTALLIIMATSMQGGPLRKWVLVHCERCRKDAINWLHRHHLGHHGHRLWH